VIVFVFGLIGLSGCESAKRDLEPSDYRPSGARWKRAASRAITDRGTWIPLAGAAAVGIGDWDAEISDWAVESTPLFGSSENARPAATALGPSTTASIEQPPRHGADLIEGVDGVLGLDIGCPPAMSLSERPGGDHAAVAVPGLCPWTLSLNAVSDL
jgi:hypothetical protein